MAHLDHIETSEVLPSQQNALRLFPQVSEEDSAEGSCGLVAHLNGHDFRCPHDNIHDCFSLKSTSDGR